MTNTNLNNPNWLEEYKKRREEEIIIKTEKCNESLKNLIQELSLFDVEGVSITFDGSGDSGSIDEIYLNKKNGESQELKEIKDQLINKLDNWAYDFLDTRDVDWYNNDGGFGEIEIDVVNSTIEYSINQRFTSSQLVNSGHVKLSNNNQLINIEEEEEY